MLVPSLDGADRPCKPVVQSIASSISGCSIALEGACHAHIICRHLQRLAFAECRNLGLLPAFQSALHLQPETRCEVAEAWMTVRRFATGWTPAPVPLAVQACLPPNTTYSLLIGCCRGGSEMQWSPASPVLIHRW